MLGYFIVLPPLMAVTVFRKFLREDGLHPLHGDGEPAAVHGGLPIKMVLRWTLNLKYLIAIPEYFLNF